MGDPVDRDERPCPFCDRIRGGNVLLSTPEAVAFPDAYPLSPGHTLVVPRRHVADLFLLPASELDDVWRLVRAVRDHLVETASPDGLNVGVNVGSAAGQTVEHAHVHVIPRHAGDVDDPRGGVRWVLPDRAPYWAAE